MKPYKISPFFRILVNFVLFLFTKRYRVKALISNEIKHIKAPYLLLGNHLGTYDPFIISYFIKKPAHFVSSDAVFRDPLIGFLFKKLGVIPKQKNARDTKVIRDMLAVAKAGGAIGLFPEGTRSWTGSTLAFDPSIAKLVKLLNITVITARMKGMQLSNPRWGVQLRRSSIEIDYKIVIPKKNISSASLTEILDIITKNISHDEVDYQKSALHKIHSKHRAEYIEHVLFLCSNCKKTGQLQSKGNHLLCLNCHQDIYINTFSFFETKDQYPIPFDNIRDAYDWQKKYFEAFILAHFEKGTNTALFKDADVNVYQEVDQKMVLKGVATACFFIDHLLLLYSDHSKERFYWHEMDMIHPQFLEKIEIAYQGEKFRLVGKNTKISGIKWEMAASVIWKMTGQARKISLYLT